MMKNTLKLNVLLGLSLVAGAATGQAIPPHHEAKIRQAVEMVQRRVEPEKPRTVLIWNTPAAFMEKDPHKGYCIPYGEAAMRLLGEMTGAYKPVVSDDIRMYLPENIQQFDAIILNNASGPWLIAKRVRDRLCLRRVFVCSITRIG